MAGNQPPAVTPTRTKRESRSRKGCPECRSRKIKCDEQKPECGQCLKTGRSCRILDSLFKPHSYSFMVTPAEKSSPVEVQKSSRRREGTDARSGDGVSHNDSTNPTEGADALPWPTSSPNRDNAHQGELDSTTESEARTEYPKTPFAAVSGSEHLDSPARMHESPYSIPAAPSEDSYQDRCEIAFFLRHFSEGPGQWMDICGGKSYFSQNAVVLAHWSPLVRYAACALGAKQLGQTRHPESQIRQTSTQSLMMKALIDTRLGFTWYGAKYYEKAIKLLANRISSKDRSYSLSPNYVYGLGLTPQSGDPISTSEGDGDDEFPYSILAACILCQYEDVNSTIRAWSGHLNGTFRLLRPHLTEPRCFEAASQVPQPISALDAVFWFVVINDMLNAFVTRAKTRISPDDLAVWRNMGLPLDSHGHFMTNSAVEAPLEAILFKALVRIMCQLMNSDLGDITQWTKMNEDLDRWQIEVPPSFYIPIAWPPVEPNPAPITDPFSREIWFASDICAITLAFYHMARMVLLANRPIRQTRDGNDLLGTYHSVQHDLRKHAMEIIPIMHAMPSETVQKYMLQPLYVAGRSLRDDKERRSLLGILRGMGDDFGLFTDYRIQDLCEEWGMPYSGIDRRDGHGILT